MATLVPPAIRWRNDRLFYTGMGILIALLVFWGFARSYYLSYWVAAPPPGTPEVTGLLHVHGLVFTLWPLLAVVQPALIRANYRRLHRRVGYASIAVAALMVVLGNLAAIAAMHVGFIGVDDPRGFYAVPFFAVNTFAVIVLLAYLQRHNAEAHKRLMLLASVEIVGAATARIILSFTQAGMPFTMIFAPSILILVGAAYDLLSRGRVHKVWIWGGGAVILLQALRVPIMASEPWLAFAGFMGSLWIP